MAELMIKLRTDVASKGSGLESVSGSNIHRTISSYGGKLGVPTGGSGESAQYFQVEGVAPDKVDALRQALEALDGVEAAYIKPSDSLP